MRGACRLILLLNLVPAVAACLSADQHSTLGCDPDHRWSRIMREIAGGQDVACTQDGDTVSYAIFSRADVSRSTGIAVARPGRFLDKSRYDKAYADAGEGERRRDFPKDGARSMVAQIVAGPGGSASTIVSSTFDERHDLKVTVIDTGSSTPRPANPVFDAYAVNQRLHQAYESAAGGPGRR